MVFLYILVATFIISAISLIGAITLFLNDRFLKKMLLVLVALSAGALIGGAFLHLLPEALESEVSSLKIFLVVILGFVTFFILEQFIHWHHHHDCEGCEKTAPFSYLILVSDALHNFIDGLVIAASFVISFPIGITTTIAVALHEIPQEMGDFGVLIYGGMKKKRALFLNFLSALVAIIGGVIGFFLSTKIGASMIYLLPFAAGNFIYIASSDLIPEIKHGDNKKQSFIYFLVFLTGVVLMLALKLFLE